MSGGGENRREGGHFGRGPLEFLFYLPQGENGQESGGHRHETLTFKQKR